VVAQGWGVRVYHYWQGAGAVGVEVTQGALGVGGRIGYTTPEGYLGEEVTSLQHEREDVQEALVGQKVGVKAKYLKGVLREGMAVYKVGEER
jgi:translation initiation factor IF-2